MKNKFKRIFSIFLCIVIFSSSAYAVSTPTGYEIDGGGIFDDITNLDYMYSYPNSATGWQLITKTRTFGNYEVSGAAAAYLANGDINAGNNWVVPGSFVIWYKAAEDRTLTKAEFYVWLNDNLGDKLPIIKYKLADGTEVTAENAVWSTVVEMDTVETNWYWQKKGTVKLPEGVKMVGIGFPHETIAASRVLFDKAIISTDEGNYPYPKLHEVYEDYFDISVAIEPRDAQLYPELMENQFNVIVPENQMKSWIHKGEDTWWWAGADAIVDYAMQNGKKVRAHALVYPDAFDNYRGSSQAEGENAWFYKDEDGNSLLYKDENGNEKVIDLEKANELTLKRLEHHIKTIVERYKGRVYAYDVINEAFMEKGAERTYLEFVKLLEGTDWITKCFEWAHEADPEAVLIYNDNGFTNDIAKQDVIYNMIKGLRDKGIPVQIGMQMHYNAMTDLGLVEDVLERFSGLCDIYITEMDMRLTQSVITDESETVAEGTTKGTVKSIFETITYPEYMYDEAMEIQARKYGSLFDLFRKYKDSIKCVGFWNSCDGRFYDGTEKYALPFDENGEPKAAFYRIIDLEKKLPRWQENDKLPQYRCFDYEIDKNTHTVLVRGNAESTDAVTAVLFNPDGTVNNRAEETANGEFLLEIPIKSEQIPSGTVPEYTLKLKIGDADELCEKFTYYTLSQQAEYYIIHDDLSNFSKMHSYYNLGLKSNHTLYDDDICGVGESNAQLESYMIYKIPDEKNVSSITVDSYIFNTASGKEFPEIYGSADGISYGLLSVDSDWEKIPKASHTDVSIANIRHHWRAEISNLESGIKYVKIDLRQFSDWWLMYIADVVIETENDASYTEPEKEEVSAEDISLYAITQRGEILTPFLHKGGFLAKTTVRNNSSAEKNISLLSAVKDGNGLLSADADMQRLTSGEEKRFSVQLDISRDTDNVFEVFLFDMSGEGLTPVLDKSTFKPR